AEDGIRDRNVTGVQTCALPIFHRDNWQIEACPHAGPSVVADNGQIYVFWFTGTPGKAGVYMAKAKEGGLDFGKPVMLPGASATRSEERRVGKGGRWRRAAKAEE